MPKVIVTTEPFVEIRRLATDVAQGTETWVGDGPQIERIAGIMLRELPVPSTKDGKALYQVFLATFLKVLARNFNWDFETQTPAQEDKIIDMLISLMVK